MINIVGERRETEREKEIKTDRTRKKSGEIESD